MLHSLFKSCKVTINDQEASHDESNYYYKAFIQNLFTFSSDTKRDSWLTSVGWSDDGSVEGWHKSYAWQTRSSYFKTDMNSGGEYTDEGAIFIGNVYVMYMLCKSICICI
jgi:hypothetical protein